MTPKGPAMCTKSFRTFLLDSCKHSSDTMSHTAGQGEKRRPSWQFNVEKLEETTHWTQASLVLGHLVRSEAMAGNKDCHSNR